MLVLIAHKLTLSHGVAEMDSFGNTPIWLIGLIGFQRACRETEPDTDQITAETPGKRCQTQTEKGA